MVTKEQAIAAGGWGTGESDFHYTGKADCSRTIGSRGGVKVYVVNFRANGKCKTWKTRPNDFRLPIKHGLYEYGYIDQDNAGDFHLASECPLNQTTGEVKNHKRIIKTVPRLQWLGSWPIVVQEKVYGYPTATGEPSAEVKQ